MSAPLHPHVVITQYCQLKCETSVAQTLTAALARPSVRVGTRRTTLLRIRGSPRGRSSERSTSRTRKRPQTGAPRTPSAHQRRRRRSSGEPRPHHTRGPKSTACRHPGSSAAQLRQLDLAACVICGAIRSRRRNRWQSLSSGYRNKRPVDGKPFSRSTTGGPPGQHLFCVANSPQTSSRFSTSPTSPQLPSSPIRDICLH